MIQHRILERLKTSFSQINKKNVLLGSGFLLGSIALTAYLLLGDQHTPQQLASNSKQEIALDHFPVFQPKMKFGFVLDTFNVISEEIKPNQFLSEILDAYHVPYEKVDALVRGSREVFDVRKLRAGKNFTILGNTIDSTAQYFIYEPDVYRYVVYDIEAANATVVEKEITTKVQAASGIIESSLWQTMVDNNLTYDLAARLEDVFGWSIDFHHIQRGDRFKIIYEQNYIEGQAVGAGDVLGAYYKNYDNEYFGIYYENGEENGFYDLEARPMKKNFLRSPVKYSRISSSFNLNRFHPVLRRRKAHLGTDYAAPYGTPIYAVADGVVTKASRTRGNGNYVKIKHDKTYQTQYLHMQKFASGVSPGVHVKQGQTIGYVGSTGLATGPHVCFRFWKNGRQVNHLRLNFPSPEPMGEEDVAKFTELKDKMVKRLNKIEFKAKTEMVVAKVEVAEGAKKKSNP